MGIRLEEFEREKETKVFFHRELLRQSFRYSDGEATEKKIYKILQESDDNTIFSQTLLNQISDWPTEYHFSTLRHNLLRHFKFQETDSVLELGAGCGAITRQLGESGAAVTAIEGRSLRAKCAAARCRDLENVNVYCADFQEIDYDRKYDYIILIGVFEYSPIFFSQTDPFAACLETVKKAIKPNGRLILAIENRLGLKYLLGHNEEHVGISYIGIQDLYAKHTAKTMGQEELRNTLIRCGFRSLEFQYPFPDYKLPRVVFMEKAFLTDDFIPGEIIGWLKFRDYFNNSKLTVFENLVWQQLGINNLIPALSNSFLVISSLEKSVIKEENQVLATMYNVERKKIYNTETKFVLHHSGRITVVKRCLSANNESNPNIMKLACGESEYVKGLLFELVLLRCLYQKDFDAFLAYCDIWVKYVIRNGLVKENNVLAKSLIKADFIDCIPTNLILIGDRLEYIDREWCFLKDYSLEMLIIRGLNFFYLRYNIENFLFDLNSKFGQMTRIWLKEKGIELKKELVREYSKAEKMIYDTVLAKNTWQPISNACKNNNQIILFGKVSKFIRNSIVSFLYKLIKWIDKGWTS